MQISNTPRGHGNFSISRFFLGLERRKLHSPAIRLRRALRCACSLYRAYAICVVQFNVPHAMCKHPSTTSIPRPWRRFRSALLTPLQYLFPCPTLLLASISGHPAPHCTRGKWVSPHRLHRHKLGLLGTIIRRTQGSLAQHRCGVHAPAQDLTHISHESRSLLPRSVSCARGYRFVCERTTMRWHIQWRLFKRPASETSSCTDRHSQRPHRP